jgi:hypothetical protein
MLDQVSFILKEDAENKGIDPVQMFVLSEFFYRDVFEAS